MTHTYRKKLIEVALPLPEINDASAYDKMPGIGPHPKGIHHWWARLPLPAARAVLFASVVDDPSEHPERFPTEDAQNAERERLFDILRSMMEKKLHAQPKIYGAAHVEMVKHCDGKLPAVYDPFAGGGSIPLEANRMGFESHAADLNPVAVLLNKCNLELAPRWIGLPPVNPQDRKGIGGSDTGSGTHGLAADVRFYGALIRERACKKIGHLYSKIRLPKDLGGVEANVIAWIWARTVASPDPAARGKHVPLISTYWLSSKKGNLAWLVPVVNKRSMTYRFEVHTGTPDDKKAISLGTKLGRGVFQCILSGSPINYQYLRQEASARRVQSILLAIVAEGHRSRIYLPADSTHEKCGTTDCAPWRPDELVTAPCHDVDRLPMYGMPTWADAFAPRQLTAMATLSDLVKQVSTDLERDAVEAKLAPTDATDYARSVTTFLALALDRCADFNTRLCTWSSANQKVMHLFGRQAIPMAWDYAEANILGDSVGAWHTCSEYVADCVEVLTVGTHHAGYARQIDAATGADGISNLLVSTDPPYYDNIGYASLSDFFYVWLRHTIGSSYPDLFSTVLVPKMRELTASPERFDGNKEKAKEHFEAGFRKAFTALRQKMDSRFPLTVYYAFKQEDEASGPDDEEDAGSGVDLTTGWETLLEALNGSGFQITGTWPVRASQAWRMRAMGSNALASYIVLACRARTSDAPLATRKEIINLLRQNLPKALKNLQHGSIAPVDLAQAAIGPGMSVVTRYAKVIESDGSPMSVRTALGIINQVLDEVLTEQEGEFDPDTRWALAWFEQYGMEEGPFGVAETLSKAKNTAVNGLVEAGVIKARGGKVRLVKRADLSDNWEPTHEGRLAVWEATQHLIRALDKEGESGAAALLHKLGGVAETARDLAYRLYTICERKKWAEEALAYNGLVIAWPELTKLALARRSSQATEQAEMF
jgi:putative DNA methylase